MRFVDFSHWAVILCFAGAIAKYVFNDIMLALQRRLEQSKANEDGWKEAVSVHGGIEKAMPFEKYMKAAEYSAACFGFGRICGNFNRAVCLAGLALCVYPLLMSFLMRFGAFAASPLLTIIASCAVVSIASTLLQIPFDLYDTFVLEAKFGFNTQTPACWVGDLVKSVIIDIAYESVVIAAAYCGIWAFTGYVYSDISSPVFVAGAVAAGCAFSLFWESFSMDFIDPLFNKFTPMEDNELKRKIVSLIESAGFSVSGIFIMDAGKRSRHSNAYFSGWGSKKRIVLYDTLLENHNDDEILAILGHEAGHLVHGDIFRQRIRSAVYSAVVVFVSVKLAACVDFYRAFGFDFVTSENIRHWYLVGFSLAGCVIGAVSWLLTPVWSWISRRDEYAADAWAKEHVSGDAMANALIGLYAENLDMLHDHPACEFWYYGHPGVKNRITALLKGD